MRLIREWSKIDKRLYIWNYATNFAYYNAPFPNLHILWDKALPMAALEEHKKHIKKSMLQMECYYLYANPDGQYERYKRFYRNSKEFEITKLSKERVLPQITNFHDPDTWMQLK